jgi:predicted Zn finger-like uncharacterized protein
MEAHCPSCGAVYPIDENRLPPEGVQLRCKSCSHVFPIYPPSKKTVDPGRHVGEAANAGGDEYMSSAFDFGAVNLDGVGAGTPEAGAEGAPVPSKPAISLPPAGEPPTLSDSLPVAPRPATGASPLDNPFGDAFGGGASAGGVAGKPVPNDFQFVAEDDSNEPIERSISKVKPPPGAPTKSAGVAPTTGADMPKPTTGSDTAKPTTGTQGKAVEKLFVRKKNNKVFGPFDVDRLRQMLATGELTADEEFSPDRQRWKPINTRADLVDAAKVAQAATDAPKQAANKAKKIAVAAAVGVALLAAAGFGVNLFLAESRLSQVDESVATESSMLAAGLYKNFAAVAKDLQQAADSAESSNDAVALYAHASAYLARYYGEKAKADSVTAVVERLKEATTSRPVTLALAHHALLVNDVTQARELLVRLKKSVPEDAEVELMLGDVEAADNQAEPARDHYNEAVRLNPKYALALHRAAQTFAGSNDEQALGWYQKALAAEPRHAWSAVEALKLLEKLKKPIEERFKVCKVLGEYGSGQLGRAELDNSRFACAELMLDSRQGNDARQILARIVEDSAAQPKYLVTYADLINADGKYGEAEKLYKRALAIDGKNVPAVTGYTVSLLRQRKIIEALKFAEKAVSDQPKVPEVLYVAGLCYEELGKPGDAEAYYGRAVALKADYLDPQLALARLYAATGRLAEAEKAIQAARSAAPDSPRVQYAMATIEYARREFAKAADILNPVVAKDDGFFDGLLLLGRAQLELGQLDEALKSLQAAEKLSAQNLDLMIALGRTLRLQNKLAEAETLLKTAAQVHGSQSEIESELGQAYMGLGHLDEAKGHLTSAITLNRRNAEAHYARGLVYAKEGDTQNAVSNFRQATVESPDVADYQRELGRASLATANLTDAVAALTKATRLNTQDAEAFDLLGRAQLRLRHYDSAIAQFRKVVELRGERADLWFQMGTVWYQQRKLSDAVKAFERAAKLDARQAGVWLSLANTYEALGKPTNRMEALRQSVKFNPDQSQAYYDLAVLLKEQGKLNEAKRYARECLDAEKRRSSAPRDANPDILVTGEGSEVLSFETECREIIDYN